MFPIQDTIPHRRPPIGMWGIILLNALVFYFELMLDEAQLQLVFEYAGVVPARVTSLFHDVPDPFTLGATLVSFLSCMFLHGGWFHIISNMWALWIFGDNVEDRMGTLRFLLFYLTCGVIASVVHVISDPYSTVPVVGASGAISGVMGAYFVFYPTARVITLVPLGFIPLFVDVPAVVFMFVWFLSQFQSGLLSLVAGQTIGGVAWWAHIGGFVAGLALAPVFAGPRGSCRACQKDEGVFELAWHRPRSYPARHGW